MGDQWAYGGHALAFYGNGDASEAADGYPGSLYTAGYAVQGLVGEINIPAPVVSKISIPSPLLEFCRVQPISPAG